MATRRVVIAGGGPAALEAALALRALASDRVTLTLIAPEPSFSFAALAVGEPFAVTAPRVYSVAGMSADLGIDLVPDTVSAVDADAREVRTGTGAKVSYEALVLAVGARPAEAVPGALTFRGTSDVPLVRQLLREALDRPSPRVAFVAAPPTAWTLPIYEMALLASTWAPGRIEPWVVTHESRPVEIFGPHAAAEVARLLDEARIQRWMGAEAQLVEDGRLWIEMEGGLPVDLALALPAPA